jgi:ubiquinone/menaquinone biosynthesis C-methylase UbiE
VSGSLDRRRLLLPEMEGMTARWYAKQRSTPSQVAAWRRQAASLTAGLTSGAPILEVAPGPGFLAVELARLGFPVTALDVSRTMVEIGGETAARAGVAVDFRQGDVSAMPFQDASFELVVCQAAFKNFRHPVSALNEMHRVLRPGGRAVIHDMRREATAADIAAEVRDQGLGPINAWVTRRILAGLRNRAHARAQFERLVAESRFGACEIRAAGIGFEAALRKEGVDQAPP